MIQLLSSRIAVITGASAGIGRACALALAAEGAKVVVNARREERLRDLVAEIASKGGSAALAAGDAAEMSVIESMLDTAKRSFGRDVDLVLVNAGRGLSGSPTTSDESQWEEMVRLNLIGAARLVRASAARMTALVPTPSAGANARGKDVWLESGRDIVILGSTVGKHISPFSSMYGSTKFAVNSIAEAVRRELSGKGVRVSSISPAVVRSEFQGVAGYDPEKFGAFMDCIGPVLEPEDIARLVVFMVSQPAWVCVNDVVIRPTRQEYP
jgi:NADP-dependent 3-hydroxy acid dehydrogenase YdfG